MTTAWITGAPRGSAVAAPASRRPPAPSAMCVVPAAWRNEPAAKVIPRPAQCSYGWSVSTPDAQGVSPRFGAPETPPGTATRSYEHHPVPLAPPSLAGLQQAAPVSPAGVICKELRRNHCIAVCTALRRGSKRESSKRPSALAMLRFLHGTTLLIMEVQPSTHSRP